MPFISKDWRSPGEEWVRYEGGWEKRKTVILVPRSDNDPENTVSDRFTPNLAYFYFISGMNYESDLLHSNYLVIAITRSCRN